MTGSIIIQEENVIKGKNVCLIPFKDKEDFEYLFSLMKKYPYEKFTEEHKNIVYKYGYKFWTIMVNNIKVGVVFSQYLPEIGYTLDGYRDDENVKMVNNKISYPIEAGKLILNYLFNITNTVYTFHLITNRAADILAKKVGFKKIEINNPEFNAFSYWMIKKE